MQALYVVLRHSALCAHLVNETSYKPDHRVSHVAILGVLKATFCVKALCHAASNAVNKTRGTREE